jgi:hypothetical protein
MKLEPHGVGANVPQRPTENSRFPADNPALIHAAKSLFGPDRVPVGNVCTSSKLLERVERRKGTGWAGTARHPHAGSHTGQVRPGEHRDTNGPAAHIKEHP